MARQKTAPAAVADIPFNESAARTELAAANQLAVATLAREQHVAALARQLNYQGSTDPAVLENSARDAIRRIGAGIFELGGYLLLLKEACQHGEFLPALERLGIGADAAQRYMAVSRRFANAATSRHLEAAGMSKLVELLPLDDGQLEDLTELGETGELSLDDVARMSVKELRAAVRKERGLAERLKAERERLEAVNAELHDEARRIKRYKPDEALARLHHEAAEVLAEVLGRARGGLRAALKALHESGTDQSRLMAGMVGQLQAVLLDLRDEFNLPDVVGDGTPEWQRWAEAQGEAVDVDVDADAGALTATAADGQPAAA